MLEVKGLSIHAGTFQVKGVSFTVAQGGCHVLLGPTGSGKTLILESIAGLRRIQAGSIWLTGRNISRTVPEKRNMAYLPQDLALFPTMSVRENIGYGLRFKGMGKKERAERIMGLASRLGIVGILERQIHNLSGGEKQRVALARALATGSMMMLLDEPLSSLHCSLRREIWYLLESVRREHKLTFLLVTHDLEEAFFLGETISIMHGGLLLQTGTKKEVFNSPASLEAARIVGVENFFPAFVQQVGENYLRLHSPSLDTFFKVKRCLPGGLFKEGDSVILGIRANSFILTASKDNGKDNRENTVSFMVEGVYEKGTNTTLLLKHARDSNSTAVAELHRNGFMAFPGQKVDLVFPGEEIMVFSAQTG